MAYTFYYLICNLCDQTVNGLFVTSCCFYSRISNVSVSRIDCLLTGFHLRHFLTSGSDAVACEKKLQHCSVYCSENCSASMLVDN